MAETTDKENKKATVVDVTAEASKDVKDESEIINTANDYKSYWEKINEDERKMSNDTPNFHIYVSYEKMDIYPDTYDVDEEGNIIKPYAKKPETKEEEKDKDKENSDDSTKKEGT